MVFGLPAFLLGPPIVLVLFVAGLAALLSVRYANVPGGAVSSPWQDLKKAVRGSG
jgi:hypothetical protein